MSGEGDIEKMVEKPTWKELLLEMIASEKLDPWNIDITALSDGFLRRVKKMKTLELHIPANVILAAAILLKYQSNVLRIVIEPQPEQLPFVEEGAAEEIPRLELVSRIPPKGPITLEDIMKEMERAISYDNPAPPKPKTVEEVITMPVPRFDIEEKMDGVFARLKEKADGEGWATFSALLQKQGPEETIETLVPLLHLSQKRMVDLKQDEFFGEIFIRLNEPAA
ncbi:Segregation and condensation protein A [uncultured archaeon]|nr:Segregation and condensation protein A [uncultured archaeon]